MDNTLTVRGHQFSYHPRKTAMDGGPVATSRNNPTTERYMCASTMYPCLTSAPLP